jgi:hypothetical protein
MPVWGFPLGNGEEIVLQALGDRAALAGANLDPIHRANRGDLSRRAG